MPLISRFRGVSIYMYFRENDYEVPHVHAVHAENRAVFLIADGTLIAGRLPRRAEVMVGTWVRTHHVALQQNWDRMREGRHPDKIAATE